MELDNIKSFSLKFIFGLILGTIIIMTFNYCSDDIIPISFVLFFMLGMYTPEIFELIKKVI